MKIKILSIIILISIFLSSCDSPTSIPTEKTSFSKVKDKELKEAILKFYSHLFNREIEEMYQLESPAFKYLYSLNQYKAFYQGFKPISKVSLIEINQTLPNIYITKMIISFKEGNKVLYQDKWEKIDTSLQFLD